ncbi:GDP-mannose 4,6-dehydratase [Methanobrevibacter sp. TLL-48-HuF1]|uniref:NAD-dependent epimerase/dehydratase family protein n=1 Tax=Methanobrevibacter sp. TLL-48-HuF1 TaxID=2870563 RepID=UPI0020265B84|nr:NAD-dependent epimerase/dehydratase family protein [Methanobrevibacter sp. TLL-48-HuF1]URN49821.1 GDP-mannose 4,6-dehydratase [Methanobrevibacter sp. TLL-48-HuF1]
MKNKNIIITGGLGFIGSHIADELIENNKVTIIDNLSSGKVENLKNPSHKNLTIIKNNLNDVNLDEILIDTDYIFHLAAMASVPLSVNDPIKCNDNNVNSTIKLLTAAKNQNVKKVIFSSSSAVYGNNTNTPLKESELMTPTSPYAASKATCELYLQAFKESYGLKSIALRYFNVFGPKQDKNSQYAAVIPNFIDAILNNKNPIIYGDGQQTRDFIYVKDVAKANISAAKSNYTQPVNIATGKKLTINRLYEIIANSLDSDLKPIYVDKRKGDITHSIANIDKMSKINFKSDYSNFEKQINKTIQWFKEN